MDGVQLSELASRLYRVRKTAAQMLGKRGYNVLDDDVKMTPQQFQTKFCDASGTPKRNDMALTVGLISDSSSKIVVYFAPESATGTKEIQALAELMRVQGASKAVLVVQEKITSYGTETIKSLHPKFMIEWFKEQELLVDITQHSLVPEHQLLTDEEKKTLLARYKLTESQLPRIQHADPVARFFGMQRGQVVKIIRVSETAGRYVTYRYVV